MVKLTYKSNRGVKMASLKDILYVIEKNTKINIYIQDLSGIFSNELCDVEPINKSYHSNLYTFLGQCKKYDDCRNFVRDISAKTLPFIRQCPCGMNEAVYPVVYDGKLKCILYAENFTTDKDNSISLLQEFCNGNFEQAKNILDNLPQQDDILQILKVISTYIVLFLKNFSFAEEKKNVSNSHWVVHNLIRHIENEYFKDINIKHLASLYGFNEKYLGRIFKSETSKTFHEYLNSVRLNKAIEMLVNSEEAVVKISKKCGFNNVTYFNRIFYKIYGKTPLEYRKSKSGRFWDKHSYLL